MIKGSIHPEDTIFSVYVPNNRASNYLSAVSEWMEDCFNIWKSINKFTLLINLKRKTTLSPQQMQKKTSDKI